MWHVLIVMLGNTERLRNRIIEQPDFPPSVSFAISIKTFGAGPFSAMIDLN
jgi:hypothetical protein